MNIARTTIGSLQMETMTQLSHFWADLHVCLGSPLRGWEDWIVNSLVLDPLLILSNSAPNMKSSASVLKLSSKGFHSAILDDRGRMKWDWPLKRTTHEQGRFKLCKSWWWWLLLDSAILHPRADPLRSQVFSWATSCPSLAKAGASKFIFVASLSSHQWAAQMIMTGYFSLKSHNISEVPLFLDFGSEHKC